MRTTCGAAAVVLRVERDNSTWSWLAAVSVPHQRPKASGRITGVWVDSSSGNLVLAVGIAEEIVSVTVHGTKAGEDGEELELHIDEEYR